MRKELEKVDITGDLHEILAEIVLLAQHYTISNEATLYVLKESYLMYKKINKENEDDA
jgi:hypothetical protein